MVPFYFFKRSVTCYINFYGAEGERDTYGGLARVLWPTFALGFTFYYSHSPPQRNYGTSHSGHFRVLEPSWCRVSSCQDETRHQLRENPLAAKQQSLLAGSKRLPSAGTGVLTRVCLWWNKTKIIHKYVFDHNDAEEFLATAIMENVHKGLQQCLLFNWIKYGGKQTRIKILSAVWHGVALPFQSGVAGLNK